MPQCRISQRSVKSKRTTSTNLEVTNLPMYIKMGQVTSSYSCCFSSLKSKRLSWLHFNSLQIHKSIINTQLHGKIFSQSRVTMLKKNKKSRDTHRIQLQSQKKENKLTFVYFETAQWAVADQPYNQLKKTNWDLLTYI